MLQVGPFKGEIIFHRNRYEDGGAFQLYANAADIIVSQHRFARTEGLLSWGRFNGNVGSATNSVKPRTPLTLNPNATQYTCRPHTYRYCPNLRVQFVDNVVEEGNHMWNWNATYPYPHPKTIEPYWIGIMASDQASNTHTNSHANYQNNKNTVNNNKQNKKQKTKNNNNNNNNNKTKNGVTQTKG